jgi:hypothetical protein
VQLKVKYTIIWLKAQRASSLRDRHHIGKLRVSQLVLHYYYPQYNSNLALITVKQDTVAKRIIESERSMHSHALVCTR